MRRTGKHLEQKEHGAKTIPIADDSPDSSSPALYSVPKGYIPEGVIIKETQVTDGVITFTAVLPYEAKEGGSSKKLAAILETIFSGAKACKPTGWFLKTFYAKGTCLDPLKGEPPITATLEHYVGVSVEEVRLKASLLYGSKELVKRLLQLFELVKKNY